MKDKTIAHLEQVDRDTRLFMAFLTLVVIIMYVAAIINQPSLRQPLPLVVCSLLIVIHLVLHWSIEKMPSDNTWWIPAYIIGQGLLAFIITFLTQTIGMMFALFMGLVGESVGLLGLKRWGILSLAYYLLLTSICLVYFIGTESVVYWLLGAIPIILFIIIYVTLYMRQAEARSHAQALLLELEQANQQLAEYADRVEDLSIANERARMARELHDTLSQGLAGLILQLEAADANLAGNRPEKAQAIIQQSLDNARTTLDEARKAISDLRLPEPIDLEEAIRAEADRFFRSSGIPCELKISFKYPIPEPVRDSIIRSVSEAFNNIAVHAEATKVVVEGTQNGECLSVLIKDDGKGFDPNHIPGGHYGLLGIRERISLAGGEFEIKSAPSEGVELVFRFQLEASPSKS